MLKESKIFNREYFEDGTTGYSLYRDFKCHYKTVEIIKERRPKNVLMIGDAYGFITKHLNDENIPSINIEPSSHCYKKRVTNHFILGSATDMSIFKDKQFDLAVSVAVLEHIPQSQINQAIREIIRVSNRSLHGITFTQAPHDIDKTHFNLQPKEGWIELFSNSHQSEIIDKEDMEKPPISIPEGNPNEIKLNIGSFINMFYYNWINIDTEPLQDFAKIEGYKFYHYDIKHDLPYPDNWVDYIFTSHLIEHLTYEEALKFLKETKRVLKHDGIMRISTPDAKLLINKYNNNQLNEYDDINLNCEKAQNQCQKLYELLFKNHKSIYDIYTISQIFKDAGFSKIQSMEPFESTSKIIEKETIDCFPTLSLYVEVIK